MVNSQQQPNVPHNRPSSQPIINAGYNIDRTHNQGLQQVNVLNPSMISTAKPPLTSRPKKMATLKTPEGKEIKLDDGASSTKNPSTTTTTPSTKPTQTINTTTTDEHVHTLLQKVSEVTVDSKKSTSEGTRAEVKINDITNDKKKPVNHKVGDKKAEDEKAEDKEAEDNKAVDKRVEDKKPEAAIAGVTKKPENSCVVPVKKVNVEKADDERKGDSKVSEESDDKENKIQIQDPNETNEQAELNKNDLADSGAPVEKIEEADVATNEKKEDEGPKTEDQDESSNSLKYEPGQYHPITNTSGKKKYSREFLMDVRNRVEKAEHISFPPSIRTDPFDLSVRFGYGLQLASRQNDSNRRQGQNNYSGRSSAGQEKQRIVITSVSLNQEVELKTTANPWKRTMDAKEDAPQEFLDTESLKKKFRSILNKLTPNNFDSLAQSVTKLNIDTESKLGDVIDIVFAKALAEPGYCVLYGQMCSHLKENTAEGTNFGTTLLKRCQSQFQSDTYSDIDLDEKRQKIEEEQDPAAKKQLEEELYENMYRCRMRGLGLIKFIGELYKIEMLNDTIMMDCIHRLLSDRSEEALECLCDLLVTIGEKLDRSTSQKLEKERKTKSAPRPNAYQGGQKLAAVVAGNQQQQKVDIQSLDGLFDQLHKLIKNNDLPLSKRIRFKLLDTCDLREKDKWQSKRTKDNNPKKIEEIRKAHEEKLEQEKRNNAMGPRRSQEHGRRLGPSGGSSNQVSSLGREPGGGQRGNMHQSASSHMIRDHPTGDMRTNQNVEALKDYQKTTMVGLGFLKKIVTNPSQSSTTNLRPVSMTKRNE